MECVECKKTRNHHSSILVILTKKYGGNARIINMKITEGQYVNQIVLNLDVQNVEMKRNILIGEALCFEGLVKWIVGDVPTVNG